MHFPWFCNRVATAFGIVCVLIAIYLYCPVTILGKQNATKTPQNPEEPLPPSSSPLHLFKQAGICSDNSACSIIARKTLTIGGSVVDAALAAQLCNGLIGLQSMGLGGGMLMNIYMHNERRAYSILSREIAPRSLNAKNFTSFETEEQFKQSGWSIAVPTELLGYALAHERFGNLPWEELVRPTLLLCQSGYALYKHQYDALLLNEKMIKSDRIMRRMFIDSVTGHFQRIGSHIQPPKQLCATYQRIAQEGPRSFYKGSLGGQLYADLHDTKSVISKGDLADAQADLRDSIVVPLDKYDLHLTPPPGSGHVLALIMNILHAYRDDFEKARKLGPLQVHRIVEAMKFGFVQRWQLDDAANEQVSNIFISLLSL